MNYTTLDVQLADQVATVILNRPDKANAMEEAMWHEIRQAMQWADSTPEVRCVVIQAKGKHFTAGIDLGMLAGLQNHIKDADEARSRAMLRRLMLDLQYTLTSN